MIVETDFIIPKRKKIEFSESGIEFKIRNKKNKSLKIEITIKELKEKTKKNGK